MNTLNKTAIEFLFAVYSNSKFAHDWIWIESGLGHFQRVTTYVGWNAVTIRQNYNGTSVVDYVADAMRIYGRKHIFRIHHKEIWTKKTFDVYIDTDDGKFQMKWIQINDFLIKDCDWQFQTSWLLILFAQNPIYLYVARLLHGFCLGGILLTVPVYLTEISNDQ